MKKKRAFSLGKCLIYPPHHRLRGAFAGADLAARSPSSRPFTGWSGSPSATDSEPTKGGSLLVGRMPTIQPSLGGRGTGAARRGWMRDASDKRGLPSSATLPLQRAHILGIVSQERLSDVGLSWLRGYRAASRPLGSKKTFFGHVGDARICSLGVRPKNLSASRAARLSVLKACFHLHLLTSSSAHSSGGASITVNTPSVPSSGKSRTATGSRFGPVRRYSKRYGVIPSA